MKKYLTTLLLILLASLSASAQSMTISKDGEILAIYYIKEGYKVEFSDDFPFPEPENSLYHKLNKDVETILGPDMLTTYQQYENNYYCVDKASYPWIDYVNPITELMLDNGLPQVQVHNRWTDLDPETGEYGEWLLVKGKNGSDKSPILSAAYGKYLTFAVTNTSKFEVFATGSANGTAEDGNYIMISAISDVSAGPITVTSTPGGIYGKGEHSDKASINLDPNKKYVLYVKGAPDVNKDIQVTGVKLWH